MNAQKLKPRPILKKPQRSQNNGNNANNETQQGTTPRMSLQYSISANDYRSANAASSNKPLFYTPNDEDTDGVGDDDVFHHDITKAQISAITYLDKNITTKQSDAESKKLNPNKISNLFIIHNFKLNKEIVKILMKSTNGFFKNVKRELKELQRVSIHESNNKNDLIYDSASSDEDDAEDSNDWQLITQYKEKFIPKLKEYLLNTSRYNNNTDMPNIISRNKFILSEPEMPVARIKNEAERHIFDYCLSLQNTQDFRKSLKASKVRQCDSDECCECTNTKESKSGKIEDIINKNNKKSSTIMVPKCTTLSKMENITSASLPDNTFMLESNSFLDTKFDQDIEDSLDLITRNLFYRSKSIFELNKRKMKVKFDEENLCFNVLMPKTKDKNKEKKGQKFTYMQAHKKNKKIVRFADSLGLDLASVRLITSNSFADIYSMDYSKIVNEPEVPTFPEFIKENVIVRPLFDLSNLAIKSSLPIRLEEFNIDYENKMIKCTVKVKNLAFNKRVFARLTFNGWNTYQDIDAIYLKSCNSPSLTNLSDVTTVSSEKMNDFFTFCVFLPTQKYNFAMQPLMSNTMNISNMNLSSKISTPESLSKVEFAICFECVDQTFWDNNDNNNYVFEYFFIRG